MRKSLIQGLEQKDMQAVVNTYVLNAFYFPTLFPLRFTPTLTWKAIVADLGIPVMADVVSFDSRAPRKTRQIVSRAQGDIPKISIGRDKVESEINEYNQLLHYANTTEGALAIMKWIWDDPEFCWTGVNARLEWLSLRAASTAKIALNVSNNAGVVTEVDVDFLVPEANKMGVTVAITEDNAATSKPITMFKAIKKKAKDAGFVVNFAFTNQDTVDRMLVSEEVIKKVAPWILQATQLEAGATLESLNKYLAAQKYAQIVVIDQILTFEDKNNDRTVVEPWEDGVITFAPEKVLGTTFHAPLADESVESAAIKVKRGHVLIKKFANDEPLVESTLGMANAFPALANASRTILVDTLNTTWTK